MAKLNWNRPNGGYTELGKNLPSMPSPLTPMARRAWATQKKNLAKKHQEANQSPEQRHAKHIASVVFYLGHYHLWCKDCQESITKLNNEEYDRYLELFPKQIRRVKAV